MNVKYSTRWRPKNLTRFRSIAAQRDALDEFVQTLRNFPARRCLQSLGEDDIADEMWCLDYAIESLDLVAVVETATRLRSELRASEIPFANRLAQTFGDDDIAMPPGFEAHWEPHLAWGFRLVHKAFYQRQWLAFAWWAEQTHVSLALRDDPDGLNRDQRTKTLEMLRDPETPVARDLYDALPQLSPADMVQTLAIRRYFAGFPVDEFQHVWVDDVEHYAWTIGAMGRLDSAMQGVARDQTM